MKQHPDWLRHKSVTSELLHWLRLNFLHELTESNEKDDLMKKLSELTAEIVDATAKLDKLELITPAHIIVDPATQTVVENADLIANDAAVAAHIAKLDAKMPAPVIVPVIVPVVEPAPVVVQPSMQF